MVFLLHNNLTVVHYKVHDHDHVIGIQVPQNNDWTPNAELGSSLGFLNVAEQVLNFYSYFCSFH